MKTGNVVQEKSYAFALRVVKMYQHLTKQRKEFVLSKQVLRSGTSIGANVEEAIGGHLSRCIPAAGHRRLLHFFVPNHGRLWKCLMKAHLGDYERIELRLQKSN